MADDLREKIVRLEEIVKGQQEDIKETKKNVEKIRDMLNGYLEKKIEKKFYEWSGHLFWKFLVALVTSSALLAVVFAKIGEWLS